VILVHGQRRRPRPTFSEWGQGDQRLQRGGIVGCRARLGRPAANYSQTMIRGAHLVLYSRNAQADRAFFRDVLDYPFVDAGHDWLIFALPPAELAIHPAEANDGHELYLMCDDVQAFVAQMSAREVVCSQLHRERWGLITHLTLPGGGGLGVYEPTHPSPLNPG